MQKLFYVSHDSKDLGPFTKDDIETKLKKKELYPSDYVYIETVEDWVMLEEFIKAPQRKQVGKVPTPPPLEKKKSEVVVHSPLQPRVEFPKQEPVKREVPAPVAKPEVQVKASVKEESPVRFSHGEAQVAVKNHKAGIVHVELVDSQKLGLQMSKKDLRVVAGEASQVHWELPTEVQVGVPARLSFKALDKFGNLDTKFEGTIKVESNQKLEGLGLVQFKQGVATKEIKGTKAESVELRMAHGSHAGLELRKPHKMHLHPAPAVRIEMDAPTEVKAGDEALVQVRALDQFGNLDVNFNQTVTVRLSGAMQSETQVKLQAGQGSVRVS